MKSVYAVIDTNVLVSAVFDYSSIPGQVIKAIGENKLIPLFDENILEEYHDVLFRNKFHFNKEYLEELLELIRKNGISIERIKTDEFFKDQDDIVFYEVLMSSRRIIDSYLVTGNMKDFPKRTYIVTPREMVDIIEKQCR